jgi:hypothetical protein
MSKFKVTLCRCLKKYLFCSLYDENIPTFAVSGSMRQEPIIACCDRRETFLGSLILNIFSHIFYIQPILDSLADLWVKLVIVYNSYYIQQQRVYATE